MKHLHLPKEPFQKLHLINSRHPIDGDASQIDKPRSNICYVLCDVLIKTNK